MQLKVLAYHCFHPVLRALRNSRQIISRIFGVRVPRDTSVQFDPTTVLLSKTLIEILEEDDHRGLEIGVGQGALVGLSLARKARDRAIDFELHGLDCSVARVESSTRVAQYNAIEARFWVSDLFSEVSPEKQYDLIFFNPPYVPTDVGQELKLTSRLQVDGDQVWDGGVDGTKVLRQFLNEAGDYLSDRGRVVFGVQEVFVPDDRVVSAVEDSGLVLIGRHRKRFVPSVVYVVGRAK